MKRSKVAVFALVLAAGVVFAVSGLVAQGRYADGTQGRRMLMLDGRGGQLGVSIEDLDAEGLKAAAGARSGVRIGEVEQDSAAARAGLREGDIIVEIDNEPVRSARQFSRVIQETPDGRSVKLGIVRDGQRQSVEVTPESRGFGLGIDGARLGRDIARSLRDLEPQLRNLEPRLRELEPRLRELEPRLRELEPRLREQLRGFRFDGPMDFDFDMLPNSPRGRLGVQLQALTPQLAEYFGAADGGVLISMITRDSAAEKAGLKAGDVITSVNGNRVRDTDDLVDELRDVASGEVTLGILRDKKELTVKATLDADSARLRRRPV